MSITKRQRSILKKIVDEFIKTGEPVGSISLTKQYKLGISPATLRAEMSNLADEGYLYKEHASSGRIPTTLGIRFYIDRILKEDAFDKIVETKLKERIFQKRFDQHKFVREAVRALSELSGNPAISVIDGIIYFAGLGLLLDHPDFEDLLRLQKALHIVESEQLLVTLFEKFHNERRLRVLIGDEIGYEPLQRCSIVYSPFNFFRGRTGFLAAIGPKSMQYSRVIPAVRDVSDFLNQSIRGWE